ncbi:hypothetical protein PG994_009313 [Apiospora phragmitis]|uniref:BRCT domain-containing protein n=1 Tax=Apiospora phragmitis TaxID=2905665 RepID=A0ABR1ULA7_9PEZI
MSLVTPPRPIFGGVVVATTGNVDEGRKDWSDTDIQRWIKAWGGSFSFDLDPKVTHLLATSKDLDPKKRSARVNSALKRKKGLVIVSLDWLEDSFIKGRKLPTEGYLLAKGGRTIAESTKDKRLRAQKKEAQNEVLAKTYVHPGLFKAYTDETFFRYEITLTGREDGERHTVTLFESNAKPYTYQVGRVYYKKKGAKAIYDRMEGPAAGGPFDTAFKDFTKFFARQTGVDWDERVTAFRKGKGKGNVAGRGFVYEIPAGGKPIGLVKGKVPDMNTILGEGSDDAGGGSASATTTTLPIVARSVTANAYEDADDSGIDMGDDPSSTVSVITITVNDGSDADDEGYGSL